MSAENAEMPIIRHLTGTAEGYKNDKSSHGTASNAVEARPAAVSQTTLYYARLKNVVLLLEPPVTQSRHGSRRVSGDVIVRLKNRPIGQPRNAVEARPASRVSGDVTARAELTDARPKYLSLLYNTEAVATGNHASSDQDSTNDPGLFLQPVVFDENSIEMLCAHFGLLGSFRLFIPSKAASDQERDSSIDRLPCPHDGLRLPEMNGSCWEVKWSHRGDSASALMTLRRVPPLTVTWAHQSAPCPSKDQNAPSTPSNDHLHHPQPVMGSSWVLTSSRDSLAQQQYSHYGHGAPTPANLPGVDRKQNAGAAAERARRPGATHPLYNRNSSAVAVALRITGSRLDARALNATGAPATPISINASLSRTSFPFGSVPPTSARATPL
ncbi:hypothetical protein B0H16DRAFT_1729851 [Mycena metata]|uniref:Uncharacterized protein n=1 Tax=Mycena metata TaxID=1033252 RepID=A0AAD7IAA9_9AGAR|nr:hypothetical protein B0H16DRAFT_1729851 [Mycena metata]